MDSYLKRFKNIFLEEASGLLDQLERDLLDLENSPEKFELIESAFRAMHTIKGTSGMYGFSYVCEFTHMMENLYQDIRDNKLGFNKEVFDISFKSVDHIRKLLADEKLSHTENQENQNKLLKRIKSVIGADETVNTNASNVLIDNVNSLKTWQILLRTNEKIHFRGINLLNIFQDLALLGCFKIFKVTGFDDLDSDTWCIILTSDAAENAIHEVFLFIDEYCTITRITDYDLLNNCFLEKKTEKSILDFINEKQNSQDNISSNNREIAKGIDFKALKRLSVDSGKLDHLMYLVSEFITLNSQFNLYIHDNGNEKLKSFNDRLDNLSKQFRNNALDLRLVPLSESVLRFKRLIRDLSKQLHKKVELVTEGIDTELDKGTIDHLNDPLLHIIRNCIDHGIELPQIRKELGKPETGIIKISAFNSGNDLIIKIEDDGTGIDLKKVKQKAIEKGILKNTDKVSEKELLEIIFMPGFSTAQNITEVSGRGVGMDVVKRKISDMRGEIEVESRLGTGTCFTLQIQQSLSIIDTLLFKVQDTYFTVAISEINKCIEINSEEVYKNQYTATIRFEEDLIPFYNLRKNLNLGGSYQQSIKAIILQKNEKRLALLTDSLIGNHQAVLKPLGSLFRKTKYINSASQLGDGSLALMLDGSELFIEANIL